MKEGSGYRVYVSFMVAALWVMMALVNARLKDLAKEIEAVRIEITTKNK